MQSKEEIVPSTSAAHTKDTLAALLARQDLQPVAGATHHTSSWEGAGVQLGNGPRCMFDVPKASKPLTESNFFTVEQLAAQP